MLLDKMAVCCKASMEYMNTVRENGKVLMLQQLVHMRSYRLLNYKRNVGKKLIYE